MRAYRTQRLRTSPGMLPSMGGVVDRALVPGSVMWALHLIAHTRELSYLILSQWEPKADVQGPWALHHHLMHHLWCPSPAHSRQSPFRRLDCPMIINLPMWKSEINKVWAHRGTILFWIAVKCCEGGGSCHISLCAAGAHLQKWKHIDLVRLHPPTQELCEDIKNSFTELATTKKHWATTDQYLEVEREPFLNCLYYTLLISHIEKFMRFYGLWEVWIMSISTVLNSSNCTQLTVLGRR